MNPYDPEESPLAGRLNRLLKLCAFPGLLFDYTFEMTLEGSLRSARWFLRVQAPEGSPYAVSNVAAPCIACKGTGRITGYKLNDTCRICYGRGATFKDMPWNGRKWRLSPHMTDGEIVQTAFKAVLTALEHEAREQFTYKGVTVFDPHYDLEALVALRQTPGGGLAERR